MGAEKNSGGGSLRRFAHWVGRSLSRRRPIVLMIEPEAAALEAWYTLLGVARKKRN